MIFNKELDKSLCLILESDKNNRELIGNFIKSLPSELYELICVKLNEYEEYKSGKRDIFEVEEEFCLSGNVMSKVGIGNFQYSFVIDMIQNSLTIDRNIFNSNGDKFIKDFGITLYEETTYNNVMMGKGQSLGRIDDYIKKTHVNYGLVAILFGKRFVCLENDCFKKYKRVRMNEISENMKLDNLFQENGFARVRKMN